MRLKVKGLVILLLCILTFSNCTSKEEKAKINVLTTFFPLYSFTKNVVGDLADVESLLPSGVGPHEYAFTPGDVKKMAEANILIKNGLGLEDWLDKLITTAGRDLFVIDTSKGVEPLRTETHRDKHSSFDPHIWLSPKNAIQQVKNIRDGLIKIDPKNKEGYEGNAEGYIRRLEALDSEIRQETATWKRKEFVSSYPTFIYFARDYGLKNVAVVQEFHGKGPTPKGLTDIIKVIKDTDVKAIFTEPQSSQKIVEAIARDLKLEIYVLDPAETGEFHPEGYEKTMRENLKIMAKAMKE